MQTTTEPAKVVRPRKAKVARSTPAPAVDVAVEVARLEAKTPPAPPAALPAVTAPQEPARPTPVPAQRFGVDFPIRVVVEHPPLSLSRMFTVTEAFDFYEVNGVAGENKGKMRKDLLVDVLEITPTTTILRITPTRLMLYPEIGKEIEELVTGMSEHYLGGKAKVSLIQWIVERMGVASDLRGRLRTVG